MHKFLITYGADSDLATFMADDIEDAIEAFIDWAPVSPDVEENRKAIVSVEVVLPTNPKDADPDRMTIGYIACPDDGSYFGLSSAVVCFVTDQSDVEEIEAALFGEAA